MGRNRLLRLAIISVIALYGYGCGGKSDAPEAVMSDGETPEMSVDGEMLETPMDGELPEMSSEMSVDEEMPETLTNGELPEAYVDEETPETLTNGELPAPVAEVPTMERQSASVTPEEYTMISSGGDLINYSDITQKAPVARINPTLRSVDPLEGHYFSFASTPDVPLDRILAAVASDIGLNLIVSNDVVLSTPISVNFERVPVREALEVIVDVADLYFEVEGNVLRIHKYRTMLYSLQYLNLTNTLQSEVGGDVLGESGDYASSALKGSYSITFAQEGGLDFYGELISTLDTIVGGGETGGSTTTGVESYSLNRATGSLMVTTTNKKIKYLERHLNDIVEKASRQVSIEAKILDVTLKDAYSYGIDWNAVLLGGDVSLAQNLALTGSDALSLNVVQNDFSFYVNALGSYGNIDTLANPILRVMNGQNALIAAGEITPFWSLEVERDGDNTTETYNLSQVLDGTVLGVTPVIKDDGTILMNIVPVATQIVEIKEQRDTSNALVASAPVLQIKEAGTVISVKDKDTVIIGGLITTASTTSETKVPFLGDVPVLGYLFKSMNVDKEKRELVIFLKTTIISADPNMYKVTGKVIK